MWLYKILPHISVDHRLQLFRPAFLNTPKQTRAVLTPSRNGKKYSTAIIKWFQIMSAFPPKFYFIA